MFDFGAVFKIAPDGEETMLYSFRGGSDGRNPVYGLMMDPFGTLYGVSTQGSGDTHGQVYAIKPNGAKITIHLFKDGATNGNTPTGELLLDKSGNIFGKTSEGGSNGVGILYKIGSDSSFTDLHDFDQNFAAGPTGGVVADSAGNLYSETGA